MFKPCKRDTSLNERDAMRDMLACEREILRLYAAAAGEGCAAECRALIARLFAQAADDACTAYTEAAAAGEPFGTAELEECAAVAQRFGKEKKEILCD